MPDQSKSTLPSVPEHTAEETGAQMVLEVCRVFLKTLILSLESLQDDLIYPEDSEDMGEWRAPQSVAFALRGTIECILADDLEPAFKSLEEAVNLTPDGLFAEWQRRKAERDKEQEK